MRMTATSGRRPDGSRQTALSSEGAVDQQAAGCGSRRRVSAGAGTMTVPNKTDGKAHDAKTGAKAAGEAAGSTNFPGLADLSALPNSSDAEIFGFYGNNMLSEF